MDSDKRKYRVTLPVDFGDGVIHQHGETVELEMETAKAYAHALIAVAENPQAMPAKKSEEQ
jgi:hypothetical protein